MDYNLAGLRQRVRIDKLDDEEFDGSVIDNFINDTQRDIFNQYELPFQEKIFQGAIPAGSTMVQLPSDLAQLQSQTLTEVPGFSQMKKKWRDFFELYPDNTAETAGAPSAWTLYANNVVLNAPADQEYTLTLYYIRKPQLLTQDSHVPEIPEEFSELLVLGAYIRVLKRNEDFDQADYVEVEYNKQLDLLVARYGFREADGAIKMKSGQRAVRRR
jgi:hypothetical protein